MFKALSVILPNTRILKDVLCCYNWDGSDSIIKIDSKVFEVTDQTHLSAIYAWTSSNFEMEKENSKSKKRIRIGIKFLQTEFTFTICFMTFIQPLEIKN